ncbi:MAG: flagellin [bacterium]|uniref:Flagellin n=1 Tax=Salipiger bermudensis (strain DSM 26914 / JCM 13377 / KCTC 12554 / HTCC2601) TaxID=314265 RepID=Q0FVE5_SALBH|nr:flagellin [Salipiger bermudensis]EAU48181.1 flagellin protein [Salipiger bermudensis HTCC2601]MBN9677517.1 flagellin [Salipiger bermudensis]MCA1286025.1 flagellin [Salipiger bermudensis]MCP4243738.1 flagellin [bacterium]
MSSILTNNGAMVALQTLKSINSSLATTQGEISTGKRVADAKDNAAVWAISKVMEADVKGFKGISDSLNLGESTVAVARSASETVTDLLTDIKGKIVAAQEENVDRAKIQTDIDALRDQIDAVVGAAQFNGLNLLSNTDSTADSGNINVLASLDRSGTGVAASDIAVAKQDLGTGAASTATVNLDVSVNTTGVASGATAEYVTFDGVGADDELVAGANFKVTGSSNFAGDVSADAFDFSADVEYVARDGDTLADVTSAMVERLNFQAASDGLEITFSVNGTNAGQIDFTNNYDEAISDDNSVVEQSDIADIATLEAEADGTIGGGLELLAEFDVTTDDGTDAALDSIEGLLQTAIDSASAFGSVQGRIETQTDFISSLIDSLKSGIGTLVDADMEEASARLQALQVQQQLGVQALSIANQAPQSLLSLFQ